MVYFCLNFLKREVYFKANNTAESGDFGKMFDGKYWGSLKILSNI